MSDYKEIKQDGTVPAYGNTQQRQLEQEPQWSVQGKEPELNPNPGYGEDGETKPATVTKLVKGESGTPVQINSDQPGMKVVKEPHNFVGDFLIKGKKLEEYIDSKGGVTEEELQAAINPILAQLGNIDASKLPVLTDTDNQEQLAACYGKVFIYNDHIFFPCSYYSDDNTLYYQSLYSLDDGLIATEFYGLYMDKSQQGVYGFDGPYTNGLNELNELFSKTKLYKHSMDITGDTADNVSYEFILDVISTESDAYGNNSFLDISTVVSVLQLTDINGDFQTIVVSFFNKTNTKFRFSFLAYDNEVLAETLELTQSISITDTVTEL